ncbi:hypothetical protein rsdtw13_30550 [Clostridium sp. TW13]|uniref:Uncharacterized protein n=1 Tax=Inconstantimicrobium mannanitabidum TaxID=1604901 RepID=A0ACB5RF20_9CLOT|nr:hypothetical protein rsdtw13_30550 [Clostridium sp. TW13]
MANLLGPRIAIPPIIENRFTDITIARAMKIYFLEFSLLSMFLNMGKSIEKELNEPSCNNNDL